MQNESYPGTQVVLLTKPGLWNHVQCERHTFTCNLLEKIKLPYGLCPSTCGKKNVTLEICIWHYLFGRIRGKTARTSDKTGQGMVQIQTQHKYRKKVMSTDGKHCKVFVQGTSLE